jgi:hypothetical protein
LFDYFKLCVKTCGYVARNVAVDYEINRQRKRKIGRPEERKKRKNE